MVADVGAETQMEDSDQVRKMRVVAMTTCGGCGSRWPVVSKCRLRTRRTEKCEGGRGHGRRAQAPTSGGSAAEGADEGDH